MDFGLSHEQSLIVDTVRNFVETELYPLEAEVERTDEVPVELGREDPAQGDRAGLLRRQHPGRIRRRRASTT